MSAGARFIYVMQAASGPVKIGFSRSPERRLPFVHRESRHGVEGDIVIKHSIPVPDGLNVYKVEHAAHALAAEHRLKGEWFNISPTSALDVIKQAISLGGISPVCSARSAPPRPKDSRTKAAALYMRVDPGLKERAQKVAAAERRSLTTLIEVAIERYCAEHESTAGKRTKGHKWP